MQIHVYISKNITKVNIEVISSASGQLHFKDILVSRAMNVEVGIAIWQSSNLGCSCEIIVDF